MNVLHICIDFGETKVYNNLFDKLAKLGVKQFVYSPRRKNSTKISFNKLNYQGYAPLIHKKWMIFLYFIKINIYIKTFYNKCNVKFHSINNYQLTHAHTLFSDGGVAYKIWKKDKIAYIVSIRSTDMLYLKYFPFLKPHGKKILLQSKKIICLSPNLKNKILKEYSNTIPKLEDKISVIPNGISDYFFDDKKENILNSNIIEKNKFIYIGELSRNKNVLGIIRYFEKKSNYNLKIIGSGGDLEKKIKCKIHKLKNIDYLGKITDISKLKKELLSSDIFIMLSFIETFGLVYIEAISQGIPIIYSEGTGVDGYFNDGEVGYKVNPKTLDLLDEKIKLIKVNYKELNKNCLKRSKEFHWDIISTKYLDLYTK